jgi:hypothetical protein
MRGEPFEAVFGGWWGTLVAIASLRFPIGDG